MRQPIFMHCRGQPVELGRISDDSVPIVFDEKDCLCHSYQGLYLVQEGQKPGIELGF